MRIVKCLLVMLPLCVSLGLGTTHTIISSGLAFRPSTLTITLGDTVQFALALIHNAVEVSQATWEADGTASNGGFSLPFGGGTIVPGQTGTLYYVCTVHAFFGMKGIITVDPVIVLSDSLLIESIVDADGSLASTGDRNLKNWSLKLYKDSVGSGIVIDSVISGSSLFINNLDPGTYVAVEADSASWSHIDVNIDGTSQGGTVVRQWSMTLGQAENHSIEFINTAPHTIINSGFTFLPDSILIAPGETIHFVLDLMHTAREVSQATWLANGTLSNGGFDLPLGGGNTILNEAGVHYYVCVPHASLAMKGRIVVSSSIPRTVSTGWNMVSLPVRVSDPRVSAVFPSAAMNAFSYQGTYHAQSVLANGPGYWLKFGSRQVVTFNGSRIAHDTVTLLKGWNIIGSISSTVPTAQITTDPPGIITSSFFGYDSSYHHSLAIVPGNGYWVKTNAGGKLMLDSTSPGMVAPSAGHEVDMMATTRLTISDAAGHEAKLYVIELTSEGSSMRADAELPPIPPDGGFDVRFTTGHQVKMLNDIVRETFPIRIASAVSPITLGWDIQSTKRKISILLDGVERELRGSGTLRIPIPFYSLVLVVSQASTLPADYSLEQAYPDPFNPTTVIEYTLPVNSRVRMQVVNVLGQVVATLIDGVRSAGRNSVVWDATGNSSGMYLVRFNASPTDQTGESFSRVLKVVLQK